MVVLGTDKGMFACKVSKDLGGMGVGGGGEVLDSSMIK